MADKRELERWITVGFMQEHIPLLHAAIKHYVRSRKLPVKYEQSAKVLFYIVASTLDRIENGDTPNDNW